MRLTFGILLSLMVGVAHANTDLTAAIENVRTTCGNISAELSDMKKMAGITTAVTGVGTVAGGVALGTGLAKANVLAGGTTATSLSATIFNATQINAIKRAATVADECEGALK